MKFGTFILCLVCLIIGIFVTALNSESVRFDYYISSIDLPLSILLVAILVAGIVAGSIICLGSVLKLRWENRSLRKKLKSLEEEVSKLQAIDSSLEVL